MRQRLYTSYATSGTGSSLKYSFRALDTACMSWYTPRSGRAPEGEDERDHTVHLGWGGCDTMELVSHQNCQSPDQTLRRYVCDTSARGHLTPHSTSPTSHPTPTSPCLPHTTHPLHTTQPTPTTPHTYTQYFTHPKHHNLTLHAYITPHANESLLHG